jgi:hypothetical protein
VTRDVEDEVSIMRVRQLKNSVDEFNKLLDLAQENDLELSIQSSIEITMRKSQPVEVNLKSIE